MTERDIDEILDAFTELRASIADLSARVRTGERGGVLGRRLDALDLKLAAILAHVDQRGEA